MDIQALEAVMSGMAKVESPINEDMPVMPVKVSANPPGTPATAEASSAESPTVTPAEPPAAAEPVVLKSGEFQDIDGFHKGTGGATIYLGPDGSLLLRFEDFKVTNGPELHVVLSPYGGPEEVGGRLMSAGWIDLGKLKGNIGNQNYVIRDDVDIGIHNSVTIWCKPFNVIFSVAVLETEN